MSSANGRPLLWILVAALAVRLLYVAVADEPPPQDTPDYDEIAHNLLAGEGFVASGNWFGHELRAWRAPLYPFFLAAIYGVHDSHTAVRLVQVLLGVVTVGLVYRLTRHLAPEAALIAGWVAALYEPLVACSHEVMSESLFTLLLVAGVGLAVEARHRTNGRWSLGAGLLLGLATLTRPVGLLALVALVAVHLAERWRDPSWHRRLWAPALLTAGTVLAVLPWTVRNALVFGEFVPISTHGGFILARSNADDPAWRQEHGWGIDPQVFVATPGEVERDRRWRAEGLQWIADHPGAWVRLVVERALRLLYIFRPDYNAAFASILPFALAGLWRRGRDPGFRQLAAVCGLSVAAFCLILYGSTRFRLPLEPFFILFAAVAVAAGWRRWGASFAGVALGWVGLQGVLRLVDDSLRGIVLSLLRGAGLK